MMSDELRELRNDERRTNWESYTMMSDELRELRNDER